MKRYHEEQHIIERNHKRARAMGLNVARGFYRKIDAYDCGRPRCGICHGSKRFGHEETRQEHRAKLAMREAQC